MKLFACSKDGGPESTVWGFWVVELKCLFSIVLLCFAHGSREAYHSHAFNSVSWVLAGRLTEHHLSGRVNEHPASVWPVITKRDTFHKVVSTGTTWVLSFRGPWADVWLEFTDRIAILTHGRKEVACG